MKYLCALLFFLCFTLQGTAQTLHFILFADTNDESKGKAVQKSKDYLCYNLMSEIRQKTNLTVVQYIYSGNQFTRDNLLSVISSLSTDSDDTILFYYDGHGYNDMSNDFPPFSLGIGDFRQGQTLLSVYQELQKKPHRLLVAISASCNKMPHEGSGELDDGRGAAGEPINIYKKLFQLSSGDYMVSSSHKDEYSWVVNRYGDLFTDALRQVIEHWYDTLPSWDGFLNAVSRQCTILASWLANKAFRSFDGQIATGDTYTPTYDNSVMEDFELVIPYSELHLLPGWNTPVKLTVRITDSNNTPLAQSEYYSFTF